MCKIAFRQFIDNKNPNYKIKIFRKVKEEITEGYIGTTPITEKNGHDLTKLPIRGTKIKGEDIFNKAHKLFDPLMEIQSITSAEWGEDLKTRLQENFDQLSQNMQRFRTTRDDENNDCYVRIPSNQMIDIGAFAIKKRLDPINDIKVYQHDYNVPRYAIVNATLNNAWYQFRYNMRYNNQTDADLQLSNYKKILKNCLSSDEDILLNCVDVHAFFALCIFRQKNGKYDEMIHMIEEMIQMIHSMTDAAWNIADIISSKLQTAP